MHNYSKLVLFIAFIAFGIVNCKAGGVKNDYKTDPATGLKYCFFKHDKNGAKAASGDIAFVRIVYKRADDSLLFDSRAGGRTDSTSIIPRTMQVSFKGCLEQGIMMMAAGDSASFLVSADSIYLKAFKLKSLPTFVKAGSSLKFYIKLVKFQTIQQLKDEQYSIIEKRRTEMKKIQNSEAGSIQKYLSDNHLKVKPTPIDSLYILERSGTAVKAINEGDSLEIKYKGMLLDGPVFDQSDRGDGGKTTLKILFKHNAQVIRGWIEVLSTMHEGEKVKILLPSAVGYGPYAAGKDIKPYTPLLFEIEVVKVITPFDK